MLLVAVLPCLGDKVFLNDGKILEGTVIKKKNTVTVVAEDGKTTEVPAEKVLYISSKNGGGGTMETAPPPTDTTPRPPASPDTPPVTPPPGPTVKRPAVVGAGDIDTAHLDVSSFLRLPSFSATECCDPRAALFIFLRRRTGTVVPGTPMEQRILKLRERAHDKKRRYRGEWASPERFITRRKRFLEILDEAEEHHRRGFPRNKGRKLGPREKEEMLAHRVKAWAKFEDAAASVQDETLRQFLLGMAAHAGHDYDKAFKHLETCIRWAPYVRCFRQGYARALLSKERYEEALREYIQIVEMSYDVRRCLPLLAGVLKDVPGKMIKDDSFKEAKTLLDSFKGTPFERYIAEKRSYRYYWLFPGNPVSADEDTLPEPPMDRLVVRRGIAVPISPSTLLVSADVIRDAAEVQVYLGDNRVTGVDFEIGDAGYRATETAGKTGLLKSWKYEFTPLETAAASELAEKDCRVFGVNLFAEMPHKVRLVPFRPEKGDGADAAWKSSDVLLWGEPGSPVITADGKLAGMLTGKTDHTVDNPTSRFFSVDDLGKILESAAKESSYSSRRYESIEKMPIRHGSFMVFAISGERFTEEQ